MRTRVKICGITNLKDARVCAESGADALGFVFFKKSPRAVDEETAGEIIRKLGPFINAVGVFVDESIDTICQVVDNSGLDAVQLHGEEGPEFIELLRARLPHTKIIKALRVAQAGDFVSFGAYSVDAVLLDTFHEEKPGGTGEVFDWDIALKAKVGPVPFILAGGLKPENIAAALNKVNPFAVDVSSGLELSDGTKDPEKVKSFMEIIKRYEETT